MRNGYFSYSQIRTYQTCPRQYFNTYVSENGKRGLPNEAMEKGTELHAEIEKGLLEGDSNVLPVHSKWFVENYFLKNDYAVEHDFEISFAQAPLKGKIDLVAHKGDEAYLIDWKKMRLPDDDDDEQLKIYALAVAENYGARYISAWYVSIEGKGYRRKDYELDELLAYRKEVQSKIDEIITDSEYALRPGGHCKDCPFVNECSAKEKFEIGHVDTLEQAQEALAYSLRAKALSDTLKEAAQGYMERNGMMELTTGKDRLYLSPSVACKFGKTKGKAKS